MVTLDHDSRTRLDFERMLVERYMPQYCFCDYGDPYFLGWQSTDSGCTNCQLQLSIHSYFPHNEPSLYVVSPHDLWKRDYLETIHVLTF